MLHWQRSCCRSRVRTAAICRKPCFLDRPCAPTMAYVLGPCLHAGCAREAWVTAGVGATAWVQGGGAWRLAWAASVGLVPITAGRASRGGVRVDSWGAGRLSVFPLRGVRYAWTIGLVRRPVALSGLLPRGPSESSGCCCVGRGWVAETFLTVRTLRVARS